jgi:hypothetical protein
VGDLMVRRESAVEYFKELVEAAMMRQHIVAGELTAFYVVQLLAGFLRRRAEDDEPLALRLVRALESGGARRWATLREIGDVSLLISGFFFRLAPPQGRGSRLLRAHRRVCLQRAQPP